MAYGGFLFLVSLYVGMVISAPAELRDPTESVVVSVLYSLPQVTGVVPPMAAALVVFWTHYRLRSSGVSSEDGVDEGEIEPNDDT